MRLFIFCSFLFSSLSFLGQTDSPSYLVDQTGWSGNDSLRWSIFMEMAPFIVDIGNLSSVNFERTLCKSNSEHIKLSGRFGLGRFYKQSRFDLSLFSLLPQEDIVQITESVGSIVALTLSLNRSKKVFELNFGVFIGYDNNPSRIIRITGLGINNTTSQDFYGETGVIYSPIMSIGCRFVLPDDPNVFFKIAVGTPIIGLSLGYSF